MYIHRSMPEEGEGGDCGGFSLQSTSFPLASKRLTANLGVLAAFGVVFGQVGDIVLWGCVGGEEVPFQFYQEKVQLSDGI